jgi:hypothetical protein
MFKIDVRVEGGAKTKAEIDKRLAKAQRDRHAEARVGYTADYAVYVHEDLTMSHPNGGEAKFLEKPTRENIQFISAVINRAYAVGQTFAEALLAGARMIEHLSLPLVPVDTGHLRGSSVTRIVK